MGNLSKSSTLIIKIPSVINTEIKSRQGFPLFFLENQYFHALGQHALAGGVGPGDPQRSLSILTIL